VTEATELALRALRHRDRSRHDLDERLAQAGISSADREQALDGLAEAGLLSDERFAEARASALAERAGSDELIRRDLRQHGIADDIVEGILGQLPPEAERAERVFARRGGDAKALRYLAGKGFRTESLEPLSASDPLHY
jgi:regulatory protein